MSNLRMSGPYKVVAVCINIFLFSEKPTITKFMTKFIATQITKCCKKVNNNCSWQERIITV